MMTAGVAMGVCVDDTVHYGTWFRRGLRMGLNRIEATRFAFENAAAAMYQSNFVVGFGLAAFGISAFMPTRRFGLLMLTLLMFGLMADLILTPAIMAGPFGRYFSKWWIKPKELEKPMVLPADSRQDIGQGKIPTPHAPLTPEPKIIPLPTTPRRRDTGGKMEIR
jgi:hypothetical protein